MRARAQRAPSGRRRPAARHRMTVRAAPPIGRVAVIFLGSKRRVAYETFKAVKRKVALGIFDDTNLDDSVFPSLLRHFYGEEAWHTWDCAFMRRHTDEAPLDLFDRCCAARRSAPREPPPPAARRAARAFDFMAGWRTSRGSTRRSCAAARGEGGSERRGSTFGAVRYMMIQYFFV